MAPALEGELRRRYLTLFMRDLRYRWSILQEEVSLGV
jgi:hypothetical protein